MKVKRIISLILVGIMTFLMVSGIEINTVEAAGECVVVSTSTTDVIVGKDVNVKVTLNCPVGLYAAQFELRYDASMFTYVSGDVGGSSYSGSIPISYLESGVPTTISWNFTFRAAKTGTSEFSVVGDTFIDKNVEGFTPAYTNAAVKVWAQGSDDATLSTLQVAGATLNPAFAKWTMQYTAYVGTEVTSVDIAAAATQGGRIEIVGNTTNLVYGNNVITVTSYAPNGKAMKYTITVVRPEPPTEPPTTEPPTEPPEWTEVELDGEVYHISPDYSKEMIPSGFEANIVEYGDNEVLAATNDKLKMQLFYLTDEESNGRFFIYDEKEKQFYPFVYIDFLENRYILIDYKKAETTPDDMEKGKVTIGEQQIDAFINSEDSSFSYFYAINHNGVYSWYCYDAIEKTVQRVNDIAMPEEVTKEEETTTPAEVITTEQEHTYDYSSENESLKNANEGLIQIRNIAIIVAGVLLVVLIGLIVVLIANKSERKHSISDEKVNYAKLEDEIEKAENIDASSAAADMAKAAKEMSATLEASEQEPVIEEMEAVVEEISVDNEVIDSEPTRDEIADFDKEADGMEAVASDEEVSLEENEDFL